MIDDTTSWETTVESAFQEIDRVLGAGALLLQVSLSGENEWTAFLSLGARCAGVIDQALGDHGPGRLALKNYPTLPRTFFPISRGTCHTPVQALLSLNELLAEIPDRSLKSWTQEVMTASLHMYELSAGHRDTWALLACQRGLLKKIRLDS